MNLQAICHGPTTGSGAQVGYRRKEKKGTTRETRESWYGSGRLGFWVLWIEFDEMVLILEDLYSQTCIEDF